jgi:quercetin dioxygenase-like cupin family protein
LSDEAVAVHQPIRCVVTGHDASGASKVIIDEPLGQAVERDGRFRYRLWSSPIPADIGTQTGLQLPEVVGNLGYANGAHFLMYDFAPNSVVALHRTHTLDFGIVLDGEVDMDLDEGSVKLRAGDVLVQRGTNHNFRNSSDKNARVAFVMIPAELLDVSPDTTRPL